MRKPIKSESNVPSFIYETLRDKSEISSIPARRQSKVRSTSIRNVAHGAATTNTLAAAKRESSACSDEVLRQEMVGTPFLGFMSFSLTAWSTHGKLKLGV
jgi:hypothetical protein